MIVNSFLAGLIDKAYLNGDITEDEMKIAHDYRKKEIPLCFSKYDFKIPDCQRQDIKPCILCKKIKKGSKK
jgi:hypothetical protein